MSEPKLTQQDVEHVAKLSRLLLDAEQIQQQQGKLASVLDYIDKLKEVDVAEVEPLAHALDLTNVFREDVETPGYATEAILANAPEQSEPYFKVPKILGEGGGA